MTEMTPDPGLVAIVSGIIKERTPHWDATPHVACATCDSANDLAAHIVAVIEPRVRAEQDMQIADMDESCDYWRQAYIDTGRERDAARAQSTAAQAEARVAESEVRVLAADLAAARAEVEFWKTQSQCNADMAAGFLAARDTARAEVAALHLLAQKESTEAFASGRREVLADLRAKVEMLRRTTEVMWDGEYVTLVQLPEVLALFEEVGHV